MIFDKDILNVTEAASYLSCSQQKIYSLIRNGNLDAYKDAGQHGRSGRFWKITAFSVDYYVRTRIDKYAPEQLPVPIKKRAPFD